MRGEADEVESGPTAGAPPAATNPRAASLAAAGPVESARSQRRRQLLDAAEAALREAGPEVAMDAVAARAGVTKPILYRHFGDRSGLMQAVARRHAERLVARLRTALAGEHDPRARLRTTIDTYLAFLEHDPALHRAAMRLDATTSGAGGALDEAQELICVEVEANIRTELAGAGLDTRPAATWGTAIVGMARLVGDRWLEDLTPPRAELTDQLTELVWRGLRGIVTSRD